jgi:hypothetical protein
MGNIESAENNKYQIIKDENELLTNRYELTLDKYERSGLIRYNRDYNKWESVITMSDCHHTIGYYDTREEAALKIKSKLKSVFGEAENRPLDLQKYAYFYIIKQIFFTFNIIYIVSIICIYR